MPSFSFLSPYHTLGKWDGLAVLPGLLTVILGTFVLSVCGLALIELIVFAIVAKCYQYRERDDPPYNQAVVEEVFGRTVG